MSIFTIVFAFLAFSGIIIAMQAVTAKPRQDLIAERLSQYRDHNLTLDEIELSLPFTERFINPALERLGALLTSRMAKNRQVVMQNKLNLAGRPYGLSVNAFEVLKVIALLVFGTLALWITLVMGIKLPIQAAVGSGGVAYVHAGSHPVRAARCRDREGASHPVRGDAAAAPAAGRGTGGPGAPEDALPDDRVHLPDPVHRPDGPGRHHHHPYLPAQVTQGQGPSRSLSGGRPRSGLRCAPAKLPL